MHKDTEKALQRLEKALLAEETQEIDIPKAVTKRRVRAYNTDRTDTDLESYSDSVRERQMTPGAFLMIAIALLLIAAVFAVLAWMVIRLRGILL